MVNTMSSPSFPTFTYTLDPEGRTYAVFAMTGQNPVTSTLYNTAGQTTSVAYTSGDADTFSFDSNTGRQNGYQFKMGSLFDTGTLTWNPNASLSRLAITDQINSANTQTCTYLYDDLGRIGLPPGSTGKSVDCGATKWQQNFSFDAFGNITKAVPTGGTGLSFSPTYNTTTNRYQTLPGFTPVYDTNGNLKADGSHTYSWDAANNPVQLDGVGVTYDALGRMVEINATTYYTQWVYAPTGEKVELMLNGQTFAGAWIPLPGGGKRLYHISNGTVDGYTRPDWLGSARLVTSDTQTLISDVAYAPYGEDYASPSPYLQFTSGSLGENTVSAPGGQGLYDFDFRKYSPAQGRWISPDPAGMAAVNLSNPQTWNRYAYVGNEPCNSIDPFGLNSCTLQLRVTSQLGNLPFPAIGLQNYLNSIFGPGGVQVAVNSSATPDYTLHDVPTLFAPPSAQNSPGALGYTTNFAGFPLNSGYILSERVAASFSGQGSFTLSYDRIAAHEFGHFLLSSPDLPFPGVGILSYGPGSADPSTNRFVPTPSQLTAIANKCHKLRQGGGKGGRDGGGGGDTTFTFPDFIGTFGDGEGGSYDFTIMSGPTLVTVHRE